jgi:uncharacterized membrane protein YphA (DoxX/SURF4 family)
MTIAERLRAIATSRWLALAFRLYLGGLFVYASAYKIQYPAEFSEVIASYQLVPHFLVNPFAVLLPWLELITGVLLIAGIRSKSATVLIGLMLLMFTLALGFALLSDNSIGCGCFHSLEDEISWKTMVRDVTWLAMCTHVFFFDSAFRIEDRYSWKIEELP